MCEVEASRRASLHTPKISYQDGFVLASTCRSCRSQLDGDRFWNVSAPQILWCETTSQYLVEHRSRVLASETVDEETPSGMVLHRLVVCGDVGDSTVNRLRRLSQLHLFGHGHLGKEGFALSPLEPLTPRTPACGPAYQARLFVDRLLESFEDALLPRKRVLFDSSSAQIYFYVFSMDHLEGLALTVSLER